MSGPMSGSSWGLEPLIDDCCVVLDARFGALGLVLDVDAGIGCSLARSNIDSAATMPPIEWPTSMVWTAGSTVGEGVPLFRAVRKQSHFILQRLHVLCNFKVNDLVLEPFSEPGDTFLQISTCLVSWVSDRHNAHVG